MSGHSAINKEVAGISGQKKIIPLAKAQSLLSSLYKITNSYKDKAKQMALDADDGQNASLAEVKFLAKQLTNCCCYADSLEPALDDPLIVLRVTEFIVALFGSHPAGETDGVYTAAGDEMERLGDETALVAFCKFADRFYLYAPESVDEMYADLVCYLVAGIKLWLVERKYIAKMKQTRTI